MRPSKKQNKNQIPFANAIQNVLALSKIYLKKVAGSEYCLFYFYH